MKLVDITGENWWDVIKMTTNETVTVKGRREPYEAKGMPTLLEDFVASNALSIVESVYEDGWIVKAIEHEDKLIGFTMFGRNEDGLYELCRIMIDYPYQNKGYGTQAIRMILEEMQNRFGCNEIYLSTDPENAVGIHVYEKLGFKPEDGPHDEDDDEQWFKLELD